MKLPNLKTTASFLAVIIFFALLVALSIILSYKNIYPWVNAIYPGVNAATYRYLVFFVNLVGAIIVLLSLLVSLRELEWRKKMSEKMKLLSTSVEQAAELVMVTDAQGIIKYVNRALQKTTGYSARHLIGKSRKILLLLDEEEADSYLKKMHQTLLSDTVFETKVVKKKKNGDLFTLHEKTTALKDKKGNITRLISTGKDITLQDKLEDNVDRLNYYDGLTGLPNRKLFVDRLIKCIEQAKEGSIGTIAVIVVDLDRFRMMNDTAGFDAGDKVLKTVAERLPLFLSEGDTVARIGSDEFGIILGSHASEAEVIPAVDKLMKTVARPINLGKEETVVTLGAGIAFYPSHGSDAVMLMKKAETALLQAKYMGRNNYQIYSKDINVKIAKRATMENNLITALKNQEYVLHYQPYCDLVSKKMMGAEALLRWKNEQLGSVAPVHFIPALEEMGMIIDVGEWVLRTACEQRKQWGNGQFLFPVSVNLSPIQFRHKYLINMVDDAIKESRLDPTHVALEITEGTFMQDLDFAYSVLKKLKNIGIFISVDDFGIGYSSLSYLKRLPVDNIKIDISFVKDVSTDPDTASIVTAIITMAHTMNIKTIAEGVDNEEQWKILRLLRCDMGQGFYISPAVPAKELEKYFA